MVDSMGAGDKARRIEITECELRLRIYAEGVTIVERADFNGAHWLAWARILFVPAGLSVEAWENLWCEIAWSGLHSSAH